MKPPSVERNVRDVDTGIGKQESGSCKRADKRFETFKRSMLQELLDDLETEIPRGEYVILVEGWNEISAEEKEQKTGWREEAVSLR